MNWSWAAPNLGAVTGCARLSGGRILAELSLCQPTLAAYTRCMRRSLLMALALLGCTQSCLVAAEKVLVEAGKFTEVFDPKAGEKEPWCINDHTFVRGPDGTWHVFAITHILPVNFARDPGKNLLHATATSLTQSPWHKEPFAVTADWDKYGEWLFWAPHVIRHDERRTSATPAGSMAASRSPR